LWLTLKPNPLVIVGGTLYCGLPLYNWVPGDSKSLVGGDFCPLGSGFLKGFGFSLN